MLCVSASASAFASAGVRADPKCNLPDVFVPLLQLLAQSPPVALLLFTTAPPAQAPGAAVKVMCQVLEALGFEAQSQIVGRGACKVACIVAQRSDVFKQLGKCVLRQHPPHTRDGNSAPKRSLDTKFSSGCSLGCGEHGCKSTRFNSNASRSNMRQGHDVDTDAQCR